MLSPSICSELVELITLDITVEHLKNLNSGHFSKALLYLIAQKNVSPKDAFLRIHNFNDSQLIALIELGPDGLTTAHLKSLRDHCKNFSVSHYNVLYNSMKRITPPPLPLEEILQESKDFHSALTKELKLSDKISSELIKLITLGITRKDLMQLISKQFNTTLHYLIEIKKFSPVEAVQWIHIYYSRIPRQLKESVSTPSVFIALIPLDITVEELTSLQIHEDFSQIDVDALHYLIIQKHKTSKDVIAIYNHFHNQVLALGLSPSISSKLMSLIYLDITIEELKRLEIKLEDLSEGHINALSYIKENSSDHASSINLIHILNDFYNGALALSLSPRICSELAALIPIGIEIDHLRKLKLKELHIEYLIHLGKNTQWSLDKIIDKINNTKDAEITQCFQGLSRKRGMSSYQGAPQLTSLPPISKPWRGSDNKKNHSTNDSNPMASSQPQHQPSSRWLAWQTRSEYGDNFQRFFTEKRSTTSPEDKTSPSQQPTHSFL